MRFYGRRHIGAQEQHGVKQRPAQCDSDVIFNDFLQQAIGAVVWANYGDQSFTVAGPRF